jgi:hypothetical protein
VVSSVFFMCLPDRVLVYGDCAVNVHPEAEDLAAIAITSADTAKVGGACRPGASQAAICSRACVRAYAGALVCIRHWGNQGCSVLAHISCIAHMANCVSPGHHMAQV